MLTLEEVEAAGGYQILLSDPPWGYANRGRGAAENHYGTMALADIQALPVTRLGARDSALFMWATWPFLPDALATGAAWGYRYKTCAFVWVKYHEGSGKRCVGGGFWSRANTEFCLLFTRGSIRRADTREARGVRQLIECSCVDYFGCPKNVCPSCEGTGKTVLLPAGGDDVLLAPRGEHSAKPAEARDRIVTMMGDLPRIELFARDRAAGWDAWGDDPALGGSDVSMEVSHG